MASIDHEETITYSYSGEIETEGITDVSEVDIEIWGAGGAAGRNRDGEYAGDGGYASVTADVSDSDTLSVVVGQGGQGGDDNAGGWGDDNGGEGGGTYGAGGGGSSVVKADSSLLARAAAGGGGEGVWNWQTGSYNLYSGGGGAPGGQGGTSNYEGEDAEGTGEGGDGAEYGGSIAGDGGGYAPGGTVQVGGGNSAATSEAGPGENGEIQITYYLADIFELSTVSTNSPVTEGDSLEVNYTVENTGGESGEQSITLTINGDHQDSNTHSVSPGSSETGTLTWESVEGEYTAEIASENDSESVSVTVESAAPSGDVRVDGQTREISGIGIRAGGELRDFSSAYTRENGESREL